MAKRRGGIQVLRSLFAQVELPPPLKPHEEAYVKGIFGACDSQRMASLSSSERSDLPPWDGPEIALAGRSNVGKSSLINALTSSTIMKASKTPGRTQQLHFISVGGKAGSQPELVLVDMPGFGFAQAPKSMVDDFHRLVGRYVKHRSNNNLKLVLLLIDSRRGVTSVDHEFMDLMETLDASFQVVFTKIDTLSSTALEKSIKSAEEAVQKYMRMHPILHLVSSKDNIGVRELRNAIVSASGALYNLQTKAQRRAIREMEAEEAQRLAEIEAKEQPQP
ncbi:GTP-binding protein [Aphanomyces cochlioides]|nr:GTP-binding protein [Aphanomyces cochlioides]